MLCGTLGRSRFCDATRDTKMDTSTNLHHMTGIEIELLTHEGGTVWTDITVSDDDGNSFELTIFDSPAIKWGGVKDVLGEITGLRARVDQVHHDMELVQKISREASAGRKAAEGVCEELRDRVAEVEDAWKFAESEMQVARAEKESADEAEQEALSDRDLAETERDDAVEALNNMRATWPRPSGLGGEA